MIGQPIVCSTSCDRNAVLSASLQMCQRVSAAVLLAVNAAAQHMMLTEKQLVQAAAAVQPRPFASVMCCLIVVQGVRVFEQ
jgi:hypothetical protein